MNQTLSTQSLTHNKYQVSYNENNVTITTTSNYLGIVNIVVGNLFSTVPSLILNVDVVDTDPSQNYLKLRKGMW